VGSLHKIDVTIESHEGLLSTSVSIEELWHLRYGHLNIKDPVLLQRKNMVKGLLVCKYGHVECEGCALRKQDRNEFPMRTNKWRRDFLEFVHTDMCGPMQTKSLGGYSYFLIFIDDRDKHMGLFLKK